MGRIKRINKLRDYFPDKFYGKPYGFEIKNGILSIYKTSGKEAEIEEEAPFAQLRITED